MGKSRGSKRGSHYSYSQSTAKPSGLLRPSLSSLVLQSPLAPSLIIPEWEDFQSINEVSDRRRFDVDPVKPARKVTGMPARLRALYRAPMSHIGFQDPKRVLICVRRKVRKEVLFANRKTRKGARGAKRRNYYSDVRC